MFSLAIPSVSKTARKGIVNMGHGCVHTRFSASKLQKIVDRRWALDPRPPGLLPQVTSYEDFVALVPPTTSADYSRLAIAALGEHASTPYYVGGSSGTTSKGKLVLSRVPIPGSTPSDEDKALVGEMLRRGVFRAGDVVVNGFMVGLFSLLHLSVNRLLGACKVTVVPLGTPDEANIEAQLQFLVGVRANVLIGTPGTLVQLAHAVQRSGVRPAIERIAFTGERLGSVKAAVLKCAFPGVKIIGLYGISECGFVGIGDESIGEYELFEDSFFLEVDEASQLLITGLDVTQPVPILRYAPGDRIALRATETSTILTRIERTNMDFNFMGNLIELRRLGSIVTAALGFQDPVFEVELQTSVDGRDEMTLRVLGLGTDHVALTRLQTQLCSLPEIREAFEKNAGTVRVVAGGEVAHATLSGRLKHRQIIDLRS